MGQITQGDTMNIINEEIRVIQNTMAHVKRAIPLALDSGERLRLENKYKELEKVLESKLEQSGDYM